MPKFRTVDYLNRELAIALPADLDFAGNPRVAFASLVAAVKSRQAAERLPPDRIRKLADFERIDSGRILFGESDPPPPLTLKQQFAAIDFAFHLPRIVRRDADGRLSRLSLIRQLKQRVTTPSDGTIDDAATASMLKLLERYDSDSSIQESVTADILWRLFTALPPGEVATLLDGSTPPLVAESRGTVNDALAKRQQEHAEAVDAAEAKNRRRRERKGEPQGGFLDGDDAPELAESPGMPFAESRRR